MMPEENHFKLVTLPCCVKGGKEWEVGVNIHNLCNYKPASLGLVNMMRVLVIIKTEKRGVEGTRR
jgi:hypothetical protein